MRKFLVLIPILIFTIGSVFSQREIPNFNVTDIYGQKHNLYDDYLSQGKHVLIEFFSVGCVTCQRTAVMFDEIFLEYGCNCGNLVVIGIDGWTYDQYVWEFSFLNNITFPLVSGNDGLGYKPIEAFDIQYTPHKILISPDAQFLMNNDVVINSADDLRTLIQAHNIPDGICKGNDFLYLEIDGHSAKLNTAEKSASITLPAVKSESELPITFRTSGNAHAFHNGTELISGQSILPIIETQTVQIASENGETAEWTININLEGTSIDHTDNDINVSLSTSSSGLLSLQTSENIQNALIKIFDQTGKIAILHRTNIIKNEPIFITGTEKLAGGIYFIQIETELTTISGKWIKQK